jgi:hypothetical protein
VETPSRVDLPPHVETPYEVFVNGVEQVKGRDFEVVGRTLLFTRPLAREGRLGFWRWLSMFLGVAGTYRKHDAVDIVHTVGGRRVVTSLEPTPQDVASSSSP